MSDPEPTVVPQGPCEAFATEEDIQVNEICDAPTAVVNELLVSATDIVWVVLGRPNIGVCEVTIFPCQRDHSWRRWARGAMLFHPDDSYGPCSTCTERGAIRLDTPVVDVTSVTVDGVELDPSEFLLIDGLWLVRAEGSWPGGAGGNDYADFSVTYQFGTPVPPLVRDATVEVAVDLWKARPGAGNTMRNADSVNRQGISFSLEEEAERVANSGMGLPALSKAAAVYNPMGQQFPTYVWSPDRGYASRTVRTFS